MFFSHPKLVLFGILYLCLQCLYKIVYIFLTQFWYFALVHKRFSCRSPPFMHLWASRVVLVVKSSPANAGDIRDVGLVPELGRSPGGGRGNLLQYSCLENPMDRGAWQAIVHGVTKNWTWLKMLRFMGSQRVGHDWATELIWSDLKQPCQHVYKGHNNVFRFCTLETLFIIVSTVINNTVGIFVHEAFSFSPTVLIGFVPQCG